MPDHDLTQQIARGLADLRMQVNALEITAKTTSLPDTIKETRATIRWSSVAIALALIASSTLRFCSDRRVEVLEKRVQALEHYHASKP